MGFIIERVALVMAEATAMELPMLVAALADAGLPVLDVGQPDQRFYCFRDQSGELIGFSGLEVRGADALLRSVLVLPSRRERGLGRAIVGSTLDRAWTLGVRQIFLLTTDAQHFFAGLGFVTIPRSGAPGQIAGTAEFKNLCPGTAICMMKAAALPP